MNPRCHGVWTIVRSICTAVFLCAAAGAQAQADYRPAGNEVGRDVAPAGTNAESSDVLWPADSVLNLRKLELNVYGLSYHPDRKTVHRLNLDNEVNPGFGLRYELDNDKSGVTFAEVGFYEDSGGNWAKLATLGYQYKFGNHWRVGGALAVMNSQTYNRGITFLAMIPLITYDFGPVKVNAIYIPKFGHYNEVAAFGLYLGIPFKP